MALNNAYLFKSKDVHVFPSSFRGEYTSGSTKGVFDPESRLNTEHNFIIPKTTLDKTSYIVSYASDLSKISFVLGGYYFEISNFKNYITNLNNNTVKIKLREISLTDNNNTIDPNRKTKVLDSFESNQDHILDYPYGDGDGDDKTYYFTGLIFTNDSKLESKADDTILLISEGEINQKAILPAIKHGNGVNTLTHGTGLVADYENQTVFGVYNDNDENNLFEIGNGSSATDRSNILEISQTTATVNSNTITLNGANDNNIEINEDGIEVEGPTKITGTTEIVGVVDITDDTPSDATDTGALIVSGGVGIGANLNVGGNTNLDNILVVKASPEDSETNVGVTGTLNVTSTTTIASNATISTDKTTLVKPVEITDTTADALKVSGDATVSKNLSVGGTTKVLEVKSTPSTGEKNVKVTGTFSTTGAASAGSLTVSGGTTITGITTIKGRVDINQSSTAQNVNINGDTTITGDTSITGDTTITGDTDITGDTTITGGVSVTGDTTITGALSVSEDSSTTLGGDLTVSGSTTLNDSLTVEEGKSTTLGGTLEVAGDTTLSGNATIAGITYITDDTDYSIEESDTSTTINAALKVDGGVNIAKKLNVNGATSLKDTLTVANGKSTTLGGALEVKGTTSLKDNLTVADEKLTLLGGNLEVRKNAYVDGDLLVDGNISLFKHNIIISDTSSFIWTGKVTLDAGENIIDLTSYGSYGIPDSMEIVSVQATINSNEIPPDEEKYNMLVIAANWIHHDFYFPITVYANINSESPTKVNLYANRRCMVYLTAYCKLK